MSKNTSRFFGKKIWGSVSHYNKWVEKWVERVESWEWDHSLYWAKVGKEASAFISTSVQPVQCTGK